MRIGDLSERSGRTRDTIRLYEKIGGIDEKIREMTGTNAVHALVTGD